MLDIIVRMSKIELLDHISSIELKNFHFPRIGREPRPCYPNIHRNKGENQFNKLPTQVEIFNEIELAKLEAIEYAETLGVIANSLKYLTCNLNVYKAKTDIVRSDDVHFPDASENMNTLKYFANVNFSKYGKKNITSDINPLTAASQKLKFFDEIYRRSYYWA